MIEIPVPLYDASPIAVWCDCGGKLIPAGVLSIYADGVYHRPDPADCELAP